MDSTAPLLELFISPGTIHPDGRMLVSLNLPNSWFNPPALLDMASGRVTRLLEQWTERLSLSSLDARWADRRDPTRHARNDLEVHAGGQITCRRGRTRSTHSACDSGMLVVCCERAV